MTFPHIDLGDFEPADWHWTVGGDEGRWWSSAAGAYVTELPEGAGVTNIVSEGELTEVLRQYGLPGPAPSAEDVKAEARRRILAIMPEYRQLNLLAWAAEASMLYGADPANWPSDQQTLATDGQAKWAAIKTIRARSNEIEAMSPIPADFRGDAYWTS